MRQIISATLLSLGIASTALAQTPVTIDDLSAPTSPAFVLLDISPAAVERPDNAKLFVVNALNRLSSADGGFPKDYALQVAPYWMVSHPGLSFEQYQNPNVTQSILQSFSVSVATSPMAGETEGADPLGTHLAIGVTTKLWNGRPNPVLASHVSELEEINGRILDALAATPPADITELRAEASAKSLEIQGLDAQRLGFFLTLSAGQVWDFAGDDVSSAAATRRGFWVTPAYRLCARAGEGSCEATFDFIAVLRTLKDPDSDAIVDYGGRFVLRPTRQFNLSVETVRRRAPETTTGNESTSDSSRTAGLLEYRISEDLIFYGTFGQDFKKATGKQPLVSLLGLNIGFGKKAIVNAAPKETAKP